MVADVYIQLSMSHSLDQLCSTSILDHYVMQPLKLVLHTVLRIIIIIDIIKMIIIIITTINGLIIQKWK